MRNRPAIQLTVRRPIEVIEAVMDFFLDRANITFEGDLSQVGWSAIAGAKASLRKVGKVSVPITAETREAICRSVLPRIGLRKRVQSVIVTAGGQRLFASYDWFGDGQTVIESEEQDRLLSVLDAHGLVKDWRRLEVEKE